MRKFLVSFFMKYYEKYPNTSKIIFATIIYKNASPSSALSFQIPPLAHALLLTVCQKLYFPGSFNHWLPSSSSQ